MKMEIAKKKRGVRWWLVGERIFQRLFHIKTLTSEEDLLLVRMRRYQGRQTILLQDGTAIKRGDQVLEIHLNNHFLLDLHRRAHSDIQLAKSLLHEMKRMLVLLASYVDHPERESVKALYGISMIHRGIAALGFSTVSISRGLFYYATTWYLRLLLSTLHPQGRSRLQKRSDQLVPKQVILSRAELVSRYAKKD